MLEINSVSNTIYLTKGDTGKITITLNGVPNNYTNLHLHFYVRNSNNLDNVKIHISDDQSVQSEGEPQGRIENSGNTWTVYIYSAATESLKRQKYVYDLKLTANDVVTTFIGGEKTKTEFWVT